MSIACAMIVGPGEGDRYLGRMLDKAAAWADHIVIVKDHVDPHTAEVIDTGRRVDGHAPSIWHYGIEESGDPAITFLTDESAVRNLLLAALDACPAVRDGDLVVVLDADEQLNDRERPVRTALERLVTPPRGIEAWSMWFFHLWTEDGTHYRADGGWAPAQQFRIFRHRQGARIDSRPLACTAIPPSAQPRAEAALEVLHWGYARPADRQAKYERYMEIDGGRFHALGHLESILTDPVLKPVG